MTLGRVWHGWAWRGRAGQGKAGHGWARHGMVFRSKKIEKAEQRVIK